MNRQQRVVREFERLGYRREARSRAPAILRKDSIEQRVARDGSVETYVNGRYIRPFRH